MPPTVPKMPASEDVLVHGKCLSGQRPRRVGSWSGLADEL
jgi:hypothetical protein